MNPVHSVLVILVVDNFKIKSAGILCRRARADWRILRSFIQEPGEAWVLEGKGVEGRGHSKTVVLVSL